jgi:predicted RNase H-like nuclease
MPKMTMHVESPKTICVVGVDCATLPSKTGLALATFENGTVLLEGCRIADREIPVANQIYNWIKGVSRVLLALDSPLGWPAELGENLARHHAGQPLRAAADALFRRKTDEVVRRTLSKAPLEVGADRIARTAVAALLLVENLSDLVGVNIPLAWKPWSGNGVRAIEVYPAGTLRSYERTIETKGADAAERKAQLLKTLESAGRVRLAPGLTKSLANEHVLDSVMCTIAAADFLQGRVIQPATTRERELARKEGWIYVKDPNL